MRSLIRSLVPFLLVFVFASCDNTRKKLPGTMLPTASQPNYYYTLYIPYSWKEIDTTLQDLRVRIVAPPNELAADNPLVNVVVADMGGKEIDEFTTSNIENLKNSMPDVVIEERGIIQAGDIEGRWFAYTKMSNGIKRESVSYIIPWNNFAYFITGATNPGTMAKYRPVFDSIVRSFKI